MPAKGVRNGNDCEIIHIVEYAEFKVADGENWKEFTRKKSASIYSLLFSPTP